MFQGAGCAAHAAGRECRRATEWGSGERCWRLGLRLALYEVGHAGHCEGDYAMLRRENQAFGNETGAGRAEAGDAASKARRYIT
jgi:hypothetical protein